MCENLDRFETLSFIEFYEKKKAHLLDGILQKSWEMSGKNVSQSKSESILVKKMFPQYSLSCINWIYNQFKFSKYTILIIKNFLIFLGLL